MLESLSSLKVYYKIVLPIAILIIGQDELFSDRGYLNRTLKSILLGPGESAEIFLAAMGGGKKQGGPEYFNSLELNVY